jgi:hypothetical protein
MPTKRLQFPEAKLNIPQYAAMTRVILETPAAAAGAKPGSPLITMQRRNLRG